MRIAILTPVGPGHEWAAWRAYCSSCSAWNYRRGPFTEFRHFLFDDREAYHGRALARNILQERAYKGWSADWVIHLDCNDFLHPAAFEAIGEAMERYPHAKGIWGCHSMLVPTRILAESAYAGHTRENTGSPVVHIMRTRFDIQPLYWEHIMRDRMVGTIGTLACLDAREAYKIGFLPDIPSGEFYEFTHAFWASNFCWKTRRPIIICDRTTEGAKASEKDPKSDHMGRLSAGLGAITEVWRERGRVPITYEELESRHTARFLRRQDFEQDVTIFEDWSDYWVYELDEEVVKG